MKHKDIISLNPIKRFREIIESVEELSVEDLTVGSLLPDIKWQGVYFVCNFRAATFKLRYNVKLSRFMAFFEMLFLFCIYNAIIVKKIASR